MGFDRGFSAYITKKADLLQGTLVPSTRQPYHSYADKIAGIKDYGLEAPTPIQRRVIKPIVEGRHWFWYTNPSLTSATGKHMVLQAPAATGKASALAIACLQKINAESETVQALILQPTTEAATACHRKILSIGEPMGIDCMACLSGTSIAENIEDLQNGPQIVVGTPGRITDLIARSSFDARNLTLCIFDGVDDSLSVSVSPERGVVHDHRANVCFRVVIASCCKAFGTTSKSPLS